MAIVQISKIIHRTGAVVDLPQLDIGEIGFATDEQRVFIGNDPEIVPPVSSGVTTQTEILTDASSLDFSRLNGASNSTLELTSLAAGQLLGVTGTTGSTTIVNVGGNVGGEINLGSYSNVKLSGGVNGYVLQTDGTGNVSWTTQGVLTYSIANVSQADPAVVTTSGAHLFGTGVKVTIGNVSGMTQLATGGVSGTNLYYVKRVSNTTFSLYTDSSFSTSVNSSLFYPATANTGYSLGTISPTGNAVSDGANTQIQFSSGSGSFGASANLTFNTATNILAVTGNVNATKFNGSFYGPFNGVIGATTANIATFSSVTVNNNLSVTGKVLGDIVFAGNIIPEVDNSTYLGAPDKRWHTLYVGPGTIDVDGYLVGTTGLANAQSFEISAPEYFVPQLNIVKAYSNGGAFDNVPGHCGQLQFLAPLNETSTRYAYGTLHVITMDDSELTPTGRVAIGTGSDASHPGETTMASNVSLDIFRDKVVVGSYDFSASTVERSVNLEVTGSIYSNADLGVTSTTLFYDTGSKEITYGSIIAASAPVSNSSPGVKGTFAYDSAYMYLCVATNTWIRAARNIW